MRAWAYTRQSDSSGDGDESLALDAQELACRDYCKARGYTIVGVERDPDLRGWQDADERPGLRRVLDAAKAGRYDVLVIYESRRLARKVRIQENVLNALEKCGVVCESVREPWFGTPLFRQILAAIAEEQTRQMAADMRGVIRAKTIQRGAWHGVAPLGYARDEKAGPLVLGGEPAQAAACEIFRRFGAGEALTAICRDLDGRVPTIRRGRYWSTRGLLHILRNPAYRGVVSCNGETRPDAHPVFIPAADLAAVDKRLAKLARGDRGPRRKPASSWLEGLVRHACGAPMYLYARASTTDAGRSPTFCCGDYPRVCRTAPARMSAPKLEAEARRLLIDFIVHRPKLTDLLRDAEARWRLDAGDAAADRGRLDAAADRAERKLERLARLALDHDLDDAWYAERRKEALAERAAAQDALSRLPAAPDRSALKAALAELAAFDAGGILELADGQDLAPILAWIGRIDVTPDGVRLAPSGIFAQMG